MPARPNQLQPNLSSWFLPPLHPPESKGSSRLRDPSLFLEAETSLPSVRPCRPSWKNPTNSSLKPSMSRRPLSPTFARIRLVRSSMVPVSFPRPKTRFGSRGSCSPVPRSSVSLATVLKSVLSRLVTLKPVLNS
jgi:hypothetical protein